MNSFTIVTIENIYKLRYSYNEFDKITIECKLLKKKGVLRYAFKYALLALKMNGILELKDSPSKGYGYSTQRVDLWQVKKEFFKVVSPFVETEESNNDTGTIRARKVIDHPCNTGISFGIVISGNENELPTIDKSINSILGAVINEENFEILICGPSDCEFKDRFSNYRNCRYINFDLKDKNRILITRKKNYLLKEAKYNIVSISHSRIIYPGDFYKKIINRKFEVVTPSVCYQEKSIKYRYLDFITIGSYDTTKLNSKFTCAAELINERFLYNMSDRVAFIDGGINIFNKFLIPENPYNENIGWGEAEDVELSEFLFQKGCLIDFFYDIECFSQTNKLSFSRNLLQKIKFQYLKYKFIK
jgi:hypothetical protein